MVRKRMVISEDFEGVDCELTFAPVEGCTDIHKQRVGDMIVMGYLVQDDDCSTDNMGDCMGQLHSFHRHAPADGHRAGLKALGNTSDGDKNLDAVWEKHSDAAVQRYIEAVIKHETIPTLVYELRVNGDWPRHEDESNEEYVRRSLYQDCDRGGYDEVTYSETMRDVLEAMWEEPAYFPGDKDAQLLACYDHGGQIWSLSGGGMQCPWDTSNRAGVWVPDQCLRDELDGDEKSGLDRGERARMYCKQFLEEYNAIINGEVYGVVVEWFDEHGKSIEFDACWNHVGAKYALETLQEEFDAQVARLQAQYDKDVHTQCGLQMEIEGL